MLILPFALVVGGLVGAATGGSFRALAELRFRRPAIVLAAIGIQVALTLPGLRAWPGGLRFALIGVSYAVVGWWLVDNARDRTTGVRAGLILVAAGWLANVIAIVPNRGMPVSAWAMREAGFRPGYSVVHGHLAKHVLASSGTWFRFLGDVIPVSLFQAVVSPGDVVMAIGIVVLVAGAMRSPAAPAAAASPGSAEPATSTALTTSAVMAAGPAADGGTQPLADCIGGRP